MTRVVGIDYSLTATGMACIDGFLGAHVSAATQLIESKHTGDELSARSLRLRSLTQEIVSLCTDADLVVVEGPSFASNSGKAHDRSGGWWLLVARLTGLGLRVAEVPPTTLKVWGVGTGRADKDVMLSATVRRYGGLLPELANNNTADAFQLASMGWYVETGDLIVDLPETHLRAVKAVRWPNRKDA